MKITTKIISITLLLSLALSLVGCGKTRHGVDNYAYMYGVSEDWSSHHSEARENLFGYGERLYNSHLILFPRKAPSSLTDFYFEWKPGAKIDSFAAYFTCTPSLSGYGAFVTALESFEVMTEAGAIKPLEDEKNFFGKAYILQWMDRAEDGPVREYIILDEENHTVVFAYTVAMTGELERNSSYTLNPDADVLSDHYPDNPSSYLGFSIYSGFEEADYSVDFLKFLNN